MERMENTLTDFAVSNSDAFDLLEVWSVLFFFKKANPSATVSYGWNINPIHF